MTGDPLEEQRGLDRRRLAWRFGRRGEVLCAWRLRLEGYRILARDVRTHVGEIDLIARRGRLLAFIEVKARTAAADEPVTARQRRRIVRAAEAWLAAHPALAGLDMRFDVMLVGGGLIPRHLEAAFRTDD